MVPTTLPFDEVFYEAAHVWQTQPPHRLIAHILKTYHEPHRADLPELIQLAQRVETRHAEHPLCPVGLGQLLQAMEADLTVHMLKEERVLFPMLVHGADTAAQAPIQVMRHEHNDHEAELHALQVCTHAFELPHDACNSWRILYERVTQFSTELREHIYLENEILFAGSAQRA